MGLLFCMMRDKENPTHLNEVDGGRVVFKAPGLRSMGLLFCYLVTLQLAYKDAAWVGLFAAIELK